MKNLIFLHGGPGFSDYLKPFFEIFPGNYNLVFYDQLKNPTVSIDQLVQQLDLIINNLEGDKILIGHSWGASLALEYIKQFDPKISALVLMSSGLSFKHWKEEFEAEKEKFGLKDAPAEMIFLSSYERKDWTKFLNDLWDSFSGESFDSLFENYIKNHDHTEAFLKIKKPVLSVFGSDDHRFPSRVANQMKALNPHLETLEVKGAGHFPFLMKEHAELVKQKIRDFLNHY